MEPITAHRFPISLFAFTALMLALPAPRASAQGAPTGKAVTTTYVLVSDPAQDSEVDFRLRSLEQLEHREAVLTRRVRGFGVGVLAASALAVAGPFVLVRGFDDSSWGSGDDGDALIGLGQGMIWGGLTLGVTSLVGLISSSARRREVRRRVREITFMPVVAATPDGYLAHASLRVTL